MIFIIVNSLVTIFFIFLFFLGIRLRIASLIPINAAGFVVSVTAIILDLINFENKFSTLVFMIILTTILILDFLISFKDIPDNAFYENIRGSKFDKLYQRDSLTSDSYKIIEHETIISEEIKNRNGYDEKAKALTLNSWRQGNQHFSEGNYYDALKRYQASLKIIPSSVAFLNQSGILIQLNEFQRAVISCDKALAINPGFFEAWINKSIALERMNRFNEAMICLKNAEQIEPKSDEVELIRGNILLKQAKYEDAIIYYEATIKLTPDYLEAWYNKGICLNKLGKTQEAFYCFDTVIKLNPKHYQAFYNRGNALNRLNQNAEAVKSYDKAIKLKPAYNEALNNRGIALYKLGRVREALKSYEKALKIKPDSFEAWINQGLLLDAMNLYEKAILSYQKFIDFAPDNMKQHVITTQKRIHELQKYLMEEKKFYEPEKKLNIKKVIVERLKPTETLL